MLKNHVEQERPGEEELGRRLEEARKRLGALQMQIKEHGLPVLVLMEGLSLIHILLPGKKKYWREIMGLKWNRKWERS